jgi:hypothetical protein
MTESNSAKINYIITSFEYYALGDIKRIKDAKMPLAVFLLGMCFIDQVAGFAYGGMTIENQYTERSKKFVTDYINKAISRRYNAHDLISLLRNNLVHNYSVVGDPRKNHGKYVLGFDRPLMHMQVLNGYTYIAYEEFVIDLEEGFKVYKEQLISNEEVQKRAIIHYDKHGILKDISGKFENFIK